MAEIRPFAGVHFSQDRYSDLSNLIAPPYDVLDEAGRAKLRAKDPHNIVNVDLPHLPTKIAGPDETYRSAKDIYQNWLKDGTLVKDGHPSLYPYVQSYEINGRTFHRRGLITLVGLSPFGAGQVVPHERTYKGPIEDRLKLMRATGAQLSPIFGLFSDPKNEVTTALFADAGKPMLSGKMDGVQNDLWRVRDSGLENRVIDLMKAKPVYIADGHHRYTTALQYQAEAREAAGGTLPASHPANFCMFVLVGMQDPGLQILPTHRIIGGLRNFDVAAFSAALKNNFEVVETTLQPGEVGAAVRQLGTDQTHTFGLYDGKNKRFYKLKLINADLLRKYEPDQSDDWRALDVAVLQRYLLDEVLTPQFAAPGSELEKAYTADADAVVPMTDGTKYQIALTLRPTPLMALERLGHHNEVMPQKSTYFFPKLATGMMINPLR